MKTLFISILVVTNLLTAKGQYTAGVCGTSMLISTGVYAIDGDDFISAPITIPFTFNFYGAPYSQLSVSTNGFITFDGGDQNIAFGLPNTSFQTFIGLVQTDLEAYSATPGTNGSIYYNTVGTSPNQVFVVHFQAIAVCCGPSPDVTGEIQLYETTDEIKIISSSIAVPSQPATMGVAKGDDLTSTVIAGRDSVAFSAGAECWTMIYAPVPLKLINFSGINNGINSNILSWTTANEVNTRLFEVQRSTNGVKFETVNSLPASVNSTTIKKYTYNDIFGFINGSVYYYRLKMIDQDRVYSYSPVVVLRKKNNESIHVSPNPFADKILINIESVDEDNAQITLREIDGKMIFQQKNNIRRGTNAIQLNLAENIQKGTYLLNVSTSKKSETIKILKQ